MTTVAVYAVLFLMVALGALAIALAMNTSRIDGIELPDADDEAEDRYAGGAW